MGPGQDLVNGRPGLACNGFNGNLDSWYYGLSDDHRKKLISQQMNIGILAQHETVNSPFYKQVVIDPNYINFLQHISDCNKRI